ncbi:helix-turn-helix domain-containing protein [Halomicrococcus gelatinilyticus]|uniref:helix-turn-helix domain-containing protein n=1 Tax=Halomicrococcus gelatinilyticus TaxID=1702103 RepID=UPI002E10BE02
MGTIVVGRIPASEFALEATLDGVARVEFEVERVVAPEAGRVMPYVWATAEADQSDALSRALEDDPTTAGVELLADLGDEWLYRMEWVDHVEFVVHVLVDADGTVMDAVGKRDEWWLRVLFPDRDSLSAAYDFCETNGIDFDVERIYQLEESPRRGQYGLTEEQYEALVTALEWGYFEVPRRVSGEELAAELGISHQALSERLRRAYRNLISRTLVVGSDELG